MPVCNKCTVEFVVKWFTSMSLSLKRRKNKHLTVKKKQRAKNNEISISRGNYMSSINVNYVCNCIHIDYKVKGTSRVVTQI